MQMIAEHDPTFDREQQQSTMYKETVFYFQLAKNNEEEKEFDALNIETYLVINSKYLYCVNLEEYTWLFEPVPISSLNIMQLSLNNTYVCVSKQKVWIGQQPTIKSIIIENEHMEDLIRFVKRSFFNKIFFEYKDTLVYKNENNYERTFNLIQMIIFRQKVLESQFRDALLQGFLEKMS